MTESTPLHKTSAIQSDDHNRGLQLDTATVREIHDVTPELARIVLHVPGFDDDALWQRPNVAMRFYLDERFGSESRVYTVRSFNEADKTVDVDVVRHGADSPMMRWLASLAIGDTVSFGGPRPHFTFPESNGRSTVLFADATSIPAIYAILDQVEGELHGRGWIATNDEVAFAELPVVPGLTLTRITPGNGFGAQLETLEDPSNVVVWGAGERDEMKQIRSFFRKTVGLTKDDVAVFGYWKQNTTNTQIDERRLAAYEEALASGGTVTELDDLALAI